jgi:hypothetical protein
VARLRIVGGEGVEQLVELREARLQIGRGRENGLVLPGAEKGVSRTHAELRLENGRYVIVDLQSQNGTWVNGRRVDRAEVPPGGEIAIGEYRLTIESGVSPGGAEARTASFEDMRLRERPAVAPPIPASRTPAATGGWIVGAGIAVLAAIILAAVAWVSRSTSTPAAATTTGSSGQATGEPRPGAAAPATVAATEAPAAQTPRDPQERLPEASPRDKRSLLNRSADVGRPGDVRVGRKPGESTEAWQARAAALQMRYGYSKAALDRNDFAAAAGGFEAILLEEPGFLDAPKLLVQAQAGLRASAANLFRAGKKLDAAGDWTGALQKYEQARQIYAALPGVTDSLQRVREKLKAAGTAAFRKGRQYEADGRPQDAVKEYEKAVQWLAPDDPNRHLAQQRIDQLKRD